MQEQHTPRKVCPIHKCHHRVKRTKLLVGHLEKKHGLRYEEALRQAEAVATSYTDYQEGSYSQDVSQAASPEPSMTEYHTPPQPEPSFSQEGYALSSTATTQPSYQPNPGYAQDQHYRQPPTPWQGQDLPHGTTSGFQSLTIDSSAGSVEDPWQYDSYEYGAEDPIVFTGWMNQQQQGPGAGSGSPHGYS